MSRVMDRVLDIATPLGDGAVAEVERILATWEG